MSQKPKLVLARLSDNGKQTIGFMLAILPGGKLHKFLTLEPAWKDNQKSISCIPAGRYEVVKRNSAKYKDHFHVKDVSGRSWILIHIGNYRDNTEGCILPGLGLADINSDTEKDVYASGAAMNILNKIMPDGFILDVIAAPNNDNDKDS